MLTLRNAQLCRAHQLIKFPDISLKPDEIIGLKGKSGIGKSSLASVLAGFTSVQAEEIQLPPVEKGSANPVQWVIQQSERAFNPRLSIKTSLRESWKCDDYLPLLDAYGLKHSWLTRRPEQLSGGQLQRFNLIRALAPSTQFLICDEITAQLDMLTQAELWQHLLEIAKSRHLGMLVISHDSHLLDAVCDKVIEWRE